MHDSIKTDLAETAQLLQRLIDDHIPSIVKGAEILVRALKTAKWKFVNGVKTNQLEFDPMLYPLEAFQVAVENAVSEKKTVGY